MHTFSLFFCDFFFVVGLLCAFFLVVVVIVFLFFFFLPKAATAIPKSAEKWFDIIICHLPGWLIPPE